MPRANCASVSTMREFCSCATSHCRSSGCALPTTMAIFSPSSIRMSLPESPAATHLRQGACHPLQIWVAFSQNGTCEDRLNSCHTLQWPHQVTEKVLTEKRLCMAIKTSKVKHWTSLHGKEGSRGVPLAMNSWHEGINVIRTAREEC